MTFKFIIFVCFAFCIEIVIASKHNLSKNNGLNELSMLQSKHSNCWKDSVKTLNSKCSELTQQSRTLLALSFTKCHLEEIGITNDFSFDGFEEISKTIVSLKNDDKAFNAYTQFFLYIENICFYLESDQFMETLLSFGEKTFQQSSQTLENLESLSQTTNNIEQSISQSNQQLIETSKSVLMINGRLSDLRNTVESDLDKFLNESKANQQQLESNFRETHSALHSLRMETDLAKKEVAEQHQTIKAITLSILDATNSIQNVQEIIMNHLLRLDSSLFIALLTVFVWITTGFKIFRSAKFPLISMIASFKLLRMFSSLFPTPFDSISLISTEKMNLILVCLTLLILAHHFWSFQDERMMTFQVVSNIQSELRNFQERREEYIDRIEDKVFEQLLHTELCQKLFGNSNRKK